MLRTLSLFALLLSFLSFAPARKTESQSPAEAHLILEMKQGCLLGATRGTKWIEAKDVAKSLTPGRSFILYTAKGANGQLTLSKSEKGDCDDDVIVEAAEKSNDGVAIANPSWNGTPRSARAIDPTDPTYVRVVADILKQDGLTKPDVKIVEGYKVDLDGDGQDEVVLVAYRHSHGAGELSGIPHSNALGDYSLVFVRKLIAGKVQDIFLAKDVIRRANEGSLPRVYHISAIADLNGDGRMEFVLYSAYYEGSSSNVIELKGNKATSVLECGCEH